MVDLETDSWRYKHLGLSHACSVNQKTAQAKLNFVRLSKLLSDSASTDSIWANCLYYEKEYSKAVRKYKKALILNPKSPNAYTGWGSALSNLGRFDEAIEKFNKALETNPRDTTARISLVLALFLKKNDKEALEMFENFKAEPGFEYQVKDLSDKCEKELELLDSRMLEATDQNEILLVQERKRGVERLLDLLLETKDKKSK